MDKADRTAAMSASSKALTPDDVADRLDAIADTYGTDGDGRVVVADGFGAVVGVEHAADFAGQKVDLQLDLFRSFEVSPLLKVRKLLPEFEKPSLVVLPGLGIQHLARVTESSDTHRAVFDQ